MRKKLGWMSVALFIFSIAQMYLLPLNGFWGSIFLVGGLLAALVTALFSTKGTGKVIPSFYYQVLWCILFTAYLS